MTKFTFIFQKAVYLSDLSLRTFSKKWSKQTPAKSSTLLCWYYFSVFWNSSLTNSNHTYVHSILWYYSLFNSNQWKWGEAKKDPSWDFNRDPPWLFTSIVILFFLQQKWLISSTTREVISLTCFKLYVKTTSFFSTTSQATCRPSSPLKGISRVSISQRTWNTSQKLKLDACLFKRNIFSKWSIPSYNPPQTLTGLKQILSSPAAVESCNICPLKRTQIQTAIVFKKPHRGVFLQFCMN